MNDPILTVVLVIGTQRERAAGALASVLAQEGLEQAEVLLVDLAPEAAPLKESESPAVVCLRDLGGLSMGEARAEAARRARGRYVAYLEEHARALPGWLEGTLQAFAEGWDAVGGEVHNPNPEMGISDKIALMTYSAWRPPARGGPSALLPGHNSAYRRDLLLSFGRDLGEMLLCEVVLQWTLGERGCRLGIDPRIRFAHINETTVGSVARGYYYWHRCFGAVRARHSGWSPALRGLRALATPLVPPVRAVKLGLFLRKARPNEMGRYWRSLPVILALQGASALGMAAGYLGGLGEAARDLTRYELEQDRGMA